MASGNEDLNDRGKFTKLMSTIDDLVVFRATIEEMFGRLQGDEVL